MYILICYQPRKNKAVFHRAMVLKLVCTSESPVRLIKMQIMDLHSQFLTWQVLSSAEIFISNGFPAKLMLVVLLRTILQEELHRGYCLSGLHFLDSRPFHSVNRTIHHVLFSLEIIFKGLLAKKFRIFIIFGMI